MRYESESPSRNQDNIVTPGFHSREAIWIFLALMLKSSICVEKYWLPNLEWETAENWIGGRVPELDSYVTFPLDMRHAVGIGKSENLRLSGIDLARTGSLVLPRNGRLQV